MTTYVTRGLLTLAIAAALSLPAAAAGAQQGRGAEKAAAQAASAQDLVFEKRLPRTKRQTADQRRGQAAVLAESARQRAQLKKAAAPGAPKR